MDKKLFSMSIAENVLVMAIHAAVAMYFDKWWIILFALLWMNTYKIKTNTTDREGEKNGH